MQISKTNSSSFGMAWQKSAKPVLIDMVATLSPARRKTAVEIINRLEQTSPLHEIRINPDAKFIYAKPQKPCIRSILAFFDRGNEEKRFLKALKGVDKFITFENASITKREPIYTALAGVLDYTRQRGILEPGVRMFDEHLPKMLMGWTVEMAQNGRTVGSVAKQIKRIDKNALKNNLRIYFDKSEISVVTRGQEKIYSSKKENASLSQLDSLERFLKLYALKKQTGEYMKRTFGDVDTRIADMKLRVQLGLIGLGKKIKNSKVGKFFASIKEKSAQKAHNANLKKEQAIAQVKEKISDALKI